MQKRSARRSTNYGRQDEESSERDDREQIDSGDSKKNNCTTDSLIADMAQGFIQAQAKATNNEMGPNNKEVMSLLEKVNSQLEEIKRANLDKNNSMSSNTTLGKQGNSEQSATTGKQGNSEQSAQDSSKQQVDQEMLKNLKTLVSTMLQGKGNSKNGDGASSNSESKDGSNQSNKKKPKQDTIDIQTVSQVLAQSQYELANELENSLQKLKQVISESEKIADKISNLLGEETTEKS